MSNEQPVTVWCPFHASTHKWVPDTQHDDADRCIYEVTKR
jgi:hypothetical protein